MSLLIIYLEKCLMGAHGVRQIVNHGAGGLRPAPQKGDFDGSIGLIAAQELVETNLPDIESGEIFPSE
jgi:hypothetical protein